MRARDVNRSIERLGGVHVRTVGSHKRYRVTGGEVTASTAVPQHPGDIPTGTLRKIERDPRTGARERLADMTYTVNVTREGDAWLADVPAVAGAHTFARSLEGLAKSAREAVIRMDGLPDDANVELDFHFDIDDESVIKAERLRRVREEIGRNEAELVSETGRVAAELSRTYSVRDTAAMLGVTAGRVSQLASRVH